MFRNLQKSGVDPLADPSAMFEATETEARRACCVKPYLSSLGKCRVKSYVSRAICIDRRHTSRCRKLCTLPSNHDNRISGISATPPHPLSDSAAVLFSVSAAVRCPPHSNNRGRKSSSWVLMAYRSVIPAT